MPVYTPADAELFESHGSRFLSYLSTARGSTSLCAWRLEIAPGTPGVAHRPSHEEVLLMLDGELSLILDFRQRLLHPGDVVHVPAGAEITITGTEKPATAWVTTTAGLQATITGGETMSPPWAQ